MQQTTKEKIYILIIILLIGASAQFYYTYNYQPKYAREVEVFYNQETELNKKIIGVIRDADKFVYFGIYTFTRTDIKDALLAAKHRGLEVKGITDRKQASGLESQKKIIDELRDAGILILEQDHFAIMHLKTVVTEKAYASGSFNWTAAATNLNDEVLEVGRDEGIRKQYQAILERIFAHYQNK